MHTFNTKTKKGFTLIELLVVISIISLLSSVVMSALTTTRTRAQVAKFKQELRQLQTAVSLYRTNNNGAWPSAIVSESAVNAIVAQLHGAGVYGSPTFTVPSAFSGGWVYNLYGMSCGQPDSSQVEYVLYFQVIDQSYADELPVVYAGGGLEPDYVCIEL